MKIKQAKVYPEQNRRVFVGLSGGVDSAVSAALLKEEGYDVTGVFIKAWTPEGYPCTWKEDRRSAMRAAAVLDIPFLTLDLEKEYKEEVVDYMITEYKAGRTPNPDVMCNKQIKFGYFLKFALENGADFIATGHYAKKVASSEHLASRKKSGKDTSLLDTGYLLLEGNDSNKDQSYFLWTLTQKELEHILFPIGHLQKPEVRKLAHKFGLPQENRKDSQGLCFLGKIDMKEFLAEYLPISKGDVLDAGGQVIGHHSGASFFTIGERHGFTVDQKVANSTPMYVIGKDIKQNTITVAPKDLLQIKDENNFLKKEVELQNQNWILGLEPDLAKKYLARVRYRQQKFVCQIKKEAEVLKVFFEEPQILAPGQSLVLYDTCPESSPLGGGQDEICLGGGIIKK